MLKLLLASSPQRLLMAIDKCINAETLVQLVQIINLASEGRTCAVVRVPGPNSDLLTHALDAG